MLLTEKNLTACFVCERLRLNICTSFTRANIDMTSMSVYIYIYIYIHYRSKVWGHLEMSLFFKEKHCVFQ